MPVVPTRRKQLPDLQPRPEHRPPQPAPRRRSARLEAQTPCASAIHDVSTARLRDIRRAKLQGGLIELFWSPDRIELSQGLLGCIVEIAEGFAFCPCDLADQASDTR
jgi:hypothetical protein